VSTPGWYPDPTDANSIRYYDGSSWTEHVQAQPSAPHSSPTPLESGERTTTAPSTDPPSTGRVPSKSATSSTRIPQQVIWLGLAAALLVAVVTPWLVGPSADGFEMVWPLSEPASDSEGTRYVGIVFVTSIVAAFACGAVMWLRVKALAIAGALICSLTLLVTGFNALTTVGICVRIAQLQREVYGAGEIQGFVLPGPGAILPAVGSLIGFIACLAALGLEATPRTASGRGPESPPAMADATQPDALHVPQPEQRAESASGPEPPRPPGAASLPEPIPTSKDGPSGRRTPDQYGQW
jgi:hypothetical protein